MAEQPTSKPQTPDDPRLCQCVGEREVQTGGDCRCGRCGKPTNIALTSNPLRILAKALREAERTYSAPPSDERIARVLETSADEIERLQEIEAKWMELDDCEREGHQWRMGTCDVCGLDKVLR